MIYLTLFLTFLKIGAISFGGGYGMISIIRESVLSNGWMTEPELLNFIAVAESTPGPIAINMATFIGSSQGGIFGAFLATLGVVLPSFLVIWLIAAVAKNLLKLAGVQAALDGIRPCIVGMILATAATMLLTALLGLKTVNSAFAFDGKSALILALLCVVSFAFQKWKKRSISPILLILFSGVLGVILFR
ncbi:MAG: chromate transporter [Clostridia bacterium]|nr:chromate transporter [Clostridia bacterium]